MTNDFLVRNQKSGRIGDQLVVNFEPWSEIKKAWAFL